jgi:hypothetical protein
MSNPFTFGGLPHMPDSFQPPETTAPKMQTFRPLGQDSPLGGMNDGSLQMRGGPMSYSERGVGTNNPNAFRVGGPRLPTGMRLLDRAARHRDPRAISQLAGMEQQQMLDQQQQTNFETGRLDSKTMEAERYKQQMERDRLNFEQSQAAWNAQHEVTQADRNTEYQRNRSDMMTDEQRQAERARTANIIIDPVTGQAMAGHLITGNGQMIRREAPPMTADDLAAARAMGGDVSMPLPGGGQVSFNAPREVPPHYTPVPSQPAMIQGQETLPDRVFDPRTGNYYPAGQAPQAGQRQQAGASGQSNSSGYNPFK